MFQLVEIEIHPDKSEQRKVSPVPYATCAEAWVGCESAAKSHTSWGYNEEQGYWWGRDARGILFRFFVEPV